LEPVYEVSAATLGTIVFGDVGKLFDQSRRPIGQGSWSRYGIAIDRREPAWQLAQRCWTKPDCPHFGEREPVANEEHLALLRQGVAIWNNWRHRNPNIRANLGGANLSGAELSRADLSGANLREAELSRTNLTLANLGLADLSGANLTLANLTRADLSGANLTSADFSGANLSGADLTRADLAGADLYYSLLVEANLSEANLSRVELLNTIFAGTHLSQTVGLDECHHSGPSTIDFRTLSQSGNLPISFLRGCGLPDNLIDYLPSLRGDASEFYSCFISYSAKDQVFAERLHADLQNKNVRCWFAPHDLPIGAKTWDAIDEEIRLRDKLLLILSKASIASEWVEDEVNKAYAEERSRKETVLFPIRIDNAATTTAEPWAAKLRDQRNIGDFRQWKKPAEYQKSLDRLLRDLKASAAK
jgi:uncharacterized protein YjbI with pentapeptide repeats